MYTFDYKGLRGIANIQPPNYKMSGSSSSPEHDCTRGTKRHVVSDSASDNGEPRVKRKCKRTRTRTRDGVAVAFGRVNDHHALSDNIDKIRKDGSYMYQLNELLEWDIFGSHPFDGYYSEPSSLIFKNIANIIAMFLIEIRKTKGVNDAHLMIVQNVSKWMFGHIAFGYVHDMVPSLTTLVKFWREAAPYMKDNEKSEENDTECYISMFNMRTLSCSLKTMNCEKKDIFDGTFLHAKFGEAICQIVELANEYDSIGDLGDTKPKHEDTRWLCIVKWSAAHNRNIYEIV